VLYLLILFAEFLGAGGDLTVDYLQDGVPEYTISVTRPAADAREILRIVAVSEDGDSITHVVEASDLVGHNYLVYSADRQIPDILNLAPALGRASGARMAGDWSLEIPEGAELSSSELDVSLGPAVHFFRRGGATVVSAPEPGFVLVVVEE
jgi:hypothetical protein